MATFYRSGRNNEPIRLGLIFFMLILLKLAYVHHDQRFFQIQLRLSCISLRYLIQINNSLHTGATTAGKHFFCDPFYSGPPTTSLLPSDIIPAQLANPVLDRTSVKGVGADQAASKSN